MTYILFLILALLIFVGILAAFAAELLAQVLEELIDLHEMEKMRYRIETGGAQPASKEVRKWARR